MSPQLNIITSESSGGGGLPTGTGTAFVAGVTDQGPPPNGPLYVECQSLSAYVNAFGPRSSTSSEVYDWLDEFFNEGGTTGKVAYVTRVTDSTATSASLTLNDGLASPEPTVLVTALTPGAAGNDTEISVTAGTGTTFTATTSSTTNPTVLTAVSSFASIGVGTPVTGTGIPAKTYITAINTSANTATMSASATASGSAVTITPGTITVGVLAFDSSGDELADESHGPYYTTAQLIADTSSALVSFAQSTSTGHTSNLPATLAATNLTGGTDATDLTDASHVAALANFPASLPCGTVSLPGKTSLTAWVGIRNHCNASGNNRWGLLDMVDESTSAAVVSQVATLPTGDWSRTLFIEGSAEIPGIGSGPARTVPGSAVVAALAAQVAQGNNQAIVPAGMKWPLTYLNNFTEFFGPGGNYQQSDVNTMEQAGINCFANFYNTLCLFGFVTPDTPDLIFDQANAARERMALVSDFEQAMAPYLFDLIDLATLEQLQADLNAVGLEHQTAGALLGFVVQTAAPVNTTATAQAGQLNALLTAQIPRYADDVTGTILTIPVSVSLPGASNS